MSKMKSSICILILSLFAVVSVAAMFIALFSGKQGKTIDFTPPPFDSAAQSVYAELLETEGLTEIYQDGMSFSAYLLGNVKASGNTLKVYFASKETNRVWLKFRIYDEAEKLIGETGLLRPGEYLETVSLSRKPIDEEKIKVKIMAYEPETYYSAGAVSLNITIQAAENDD